MVWEVDQLAAVIREVGFYRLAGSDGCLCSHLRAHGISVDVSCYKGSAITTDYYPSITVRVSTPPDLIRPEELRPIALLCKDAIQASHKGAEVVIVYQEYPSEAIAERFPALSPDDY